MNEKEAVRRATDVTNESEPLSSVDAETSSSVEAGNAIEVVERILRDFIEQTLWEKFGDSWIEESGVTSDRVSRWQSNKEEEAKRREGGRISERLIDYSEFADLQTILRKRWELFSPCFGELRTMDVYLDRLIDFRHPRAHGRGLLPFEQHLALGISGEIRNKVTIYRSEQGSEPEYFPRIEYVRDSFGNVVGGKSNFGQTGLTLSPGDRVEFVVRVGIPRGCRSRGRSALVVGQAPSTWPMIEGSG